MSSNQAVSRGAGRTRSLGCLQRLTRRRPITCSALPIFQFNDDVERRNLPEQGLWASPESHGDGVNQRLFEFVEDLLDVSVPCRTQASIAFMACLGLFTGSFRISSSSICSFSVSGCSIQVVITF